MSKASSGAQWVRVAHGRVCIPHGFGAVEAAQRVAWEEGHIQNPVPTSEILHQEAQTTPQLGDSDIHRG